MDAEDEIPANLKALASELDLLGDILPAGPAVDGFPDLSGTDFQPIAAIGCGGMGTVYRALQTSLDRPVAVTCLELAAGTNDFDRKSDFARILAKASAQRASERYPAVSALADDLRRCRAGEPTAANPPSPMRRLHLWARRNPPAALGLLSTVLLLVGLLVVLSVSYARISDALAEKSAALAQTEREATVAAQSLSEVITTIDRSQPDHRDAELKRALGAAEKLARRFPGNAEIRAVVDRLTYAREMHAKIRAKQRVSGRSLRPLRRPPPGREDSENNL